MDQSVDETLTEKLWS